MGDWSPQDALKAYLHTLRLCKIQNDEDSLTSHGSTNNDSIIEPKCMEFISALAAGNRARVMLQVTSQRITPLTVSLAVAAKQAGGRLIVCITRDHDDDDDHVDGEEEEISKTLIVENGLEDAIEYACDDDPCRVVKHLKNIDFLVIDFKFEHHVELLKIVRFNPKGFVVVVNNVDNIGGDAPIFLLDQVFKEKRGFQYVTLPLGEGIELTRFRPINGNGRCQSKRSCKRFHVTFEN